MAHVLRITDGTITVTFTSGNMFLSSYIPQISRDGSPVEEFAVVGFTGGLTTARANVQIINRLFVEAANWQRNKSGKKVYVEFDPDTSGAAYRSLLYGGAVEMTDDLLGNQWGSGTLELNVGWLRQPFWEGALMQIPLTSFSSTSTTDFAAINNRNDASGGNWANISSSDVIGDLPAPLKIQMVNSTTDSNQADEIYIWHNVYSNPFSFAHFLEGESSSDAASSTSATANAGAYGTFSWATTDETRLGRWTFPSSDLADAAGGRFGVLARWPAAFPYTDCWLRLTLKTIATESNLWEGNLSLIAPTTDIQQKELTLLDTLRLPPYLEGQTALRSVALILYGSRSSTNNDIDLDYLQLSPISGDSGWKHFVSVGRGVAAGESFVHDGTEQPNQNYRQDTNSKWIAEFTGSGGPILLIPNTNQRLIFNTADYLGAAKITQNWSVKLWYRPRRSSL